MQSAEKKPTTNYQKDFKRAEEKIYSDSLKKETSKWQNKKCEPNFGGKKTLSSNQKENKRNFTHVWSNHGPCVHVHSGIRRQYSVHVLNIQALDIHPLGFRIRVL